MLTNEKGAAPCGTSPIGTLVALCKEGRIGMAGEFQWYRHAFAPNAFGGKKVKAVEP
jgi:hypothetical protein